MASVEAVEAILSALVYDNTSDNPRTSRTYSLDLTDGDGSIQDPSSFSIAITQEADLGAAEAVGTRNGPEFIVNTTTFDDQQDPQVSGISDGRWVVVWEAPRQDGRRR